MKAAVCKSLDGPAGITIETLPDPVPAEGEVVIRVRAAALNFLDTLITRGKYQYKPDLPFSPGAEVAGTIERLGPGVTGLEAGQRVCAYLGWGGARELVAVQAERVTPVPAGVREEVAAGVNVTYGTAMHALADRARLRRGERLPARRAAPAGRARRSRAGGPPAAR